jgi:D-arabinose 1-dehydrogenase-like Zn-dependent alcohol dehydrogenase
MGTRHELERLLALVARTGLRPEVEATYDLSDARSAFGRLLSGGVDGKLVLKAT